jgi:hypothetical protein
VIVLVAVIVALAGTTATWAEAAGDSDEATSGEGASNLGEALKQGKFSVDLRYRIELVDDDAQPKDATASTLRTSVRYETLPWKGVSAMVEVEDVSAIGND